KRDINDAIFSTNGVRDLPIEMRLQFIKDDEKPVAKLSVLTLLNPPEMPMAATNGDPDTRLRILAVVFDHNGKYLGVMDKNVDVKWLSNDNRTKTAAKYDFILDSGDYLVRLVVRDSNTRKIFAEASTVKIP